MMIKLGFIGLGKVGTTLALAWHQVGVSVVAVHSRHENITLAKQVNALWCADPAEVIEKADVIFLSVTDSAIALVTAQLYAEHANLTDKIILHCSGALTSAVLSPLSEQNAQIGSLHPALPFAEPAITLSKLEGSVFVLETSFPLVAETCQTLCDLLGIRLAYIEASMKSLYHVALVYASNYVVTLYSIAERILEQIQLDQPERSQILKTLLDATVQNILQYGATDALTGPLVRGDVNVVEAHLERLPTPTLKELYRLLALETFPLLIERGTDTTLLAHILTRRS
ncbi:MAG: Rossmann-like and DUF2520 domain-containing protein [Phototrophicaceae bacterium]